MDKEKIAIFERDLKNRPVLHMRLTGESLSVIKD
jgi:hypothetical protein